jgi:hypothetical protein
MPITDMTRPIRCGPAVCASTLIPTGMIRPPPKPWSTRKPISISADAASPHSAEPTPKEATETSHTRRDPKRSDSQPASGMTIASDSR